MDLHLSAHKSKIGEIGHLSSYASLTLGSLELNTSRNGVDPDLIWLFRPGDKKLSHISSDTGDISGDAFVEGDDFDDEYALAAVQYRCLATEVRDRLELKGFTLDVARARFQARLRDEISSVECGDRYLISRSRPEKLSKAERKSLRILKALTPETWSEAVVRIKEECLSEKSLRKSQAKNEQLRLLRYMLKRPGPFYGYPGLDYDVPTHDYLLFLRLTIETADPDEYLVYDLSELVNAGWVDQDNDHVALAEAETRKNAALSQKVIVLTEGTTDKDILERSLKLLYPHLSDCFHFFDFDLNRTNRVGGGVGPLANLVRAFAGANVSHRILALFDNDTAAKEALINLDPSILPENIVIKHYPDLEICEKYPTVGPSGREIMNVNGLAGSLELYLGEDVLRDSSGELIPVQWAGPSKAVQAYQGEVRDKRDIHKRYLDKLDECESSPERTHRYDWEGIREIIEVMRTAFHDLDAQIIDSSYDSIL